MKIILNEKEVAENIISTNTKFRNVNVTIDLLVKYWNNEGMCKTCILRELDKFLTRTHKSYNKVRWADRIEGTVNWHIKNNFKLTMVEKVEITKKELDYIRGMDNIVCERIAFVMLVYAKILNQINDKNNNYVKNIMDDILRVSKVSGTTDRKYRYIHQIKEYGGIERPMRVDGKSVSVGFIDEEGESFMDITDFREVVLEYLKWRGERIEICSKCGVRIKGYNTKKYCDDCSSRVNLKKSRENMGKIRNV